MGSPNYSKDRKNGKIRSDIRETKRLFSDFMIRLPIEEWPSYDSLEERPKFLLWRSTQIKNWLDLH